MVGFVDDCTQRVNAFSDDPQPNNATLLRKMTHDAQLWRDLLFASGGELELSKCSFYFIESDVTTDGTPFPRGGFFVPPISIQGYNGTVEVPQESNYKSTRSLGCHINPANTMITQTRILQEKSDRHVHILLSTHSPDRKQI